MRGKLEALLPLLVILPALACGARVTPGVAPGDERIARVHQSRCGACHVPIEPGERTRPELDAALARHRRRVRLTQGEWARMIDYLAARDGTEAGKATTA